jgi:hypothetical protein
MAVGKPGSVYVAWCDDRRQPGDWDLVISRSTNSGDTFSGPAYVYKGHTAGEMSIMPSIDVDPYGRIYVAWYHFDPEAGAWEILCSCSADGGKTFCSPVRVSQSRFPGGGYMGDLLSLVCDWNYVYVAWSDNRTGDFGIYFSRANLAPRSASDEFPRAANLP